MTDITTPQVPPTDPSGQQATGPAERAKEQATGVAGTAKDQAAGVAETAKDQAANVASTAAEQARSVASEAATEAKNLMVDARQQLRTQADEQASKVASLVGDLGGQLRTMADAGQSGPAKDIVAAVADQADAMAQRMRDGGLDRTLQDARRLARNRPGVFLAGAALAGFVAARVARTADTEALKQAASPSQGTNGSNGHGQPGPLPTSPDLTLEAMPAIAAERPLVADPVPPSATTATMPTSEGPR